MGLTPTNKTRNEWRYGSKGSLSLDLDNDQFYDHEAEVGGGVLQLIIHKGHATNDQEAYQFLKDSGLISEDVSYFNKTYSEQRHHIYVDENGNWLRKATKFTNGKWVQSRWENEQWQPKVLGVRNVPYGLNKLINEPKDGFCFVFEGEKDVERAWQHGLSATCNVGGAGKWAPELNQFLIERTVCIVPDNDTAGSNHARKVEASLRSAGIDCFILWDYTDALNTKADFSDWMNLNNNDVEKFLRLVRSTQKAPRRTETPNDEEKLSLPLSNRKPTKTNLQTS